MDTNIKQDLVNKAIEAKENSYSPYSKFRVGCSLLTKDGTVYTGKLILTESFSSELLFNL
jgi:cytidine deaminase